jgi:hypothetical protein
MQEDDWITLPNLDNKPTYVRWLLMLTIWSCWAIVVFKTSSSISTFIIQLFEWFFGLTGVCFFLSLGFCLVEWVVRSMLHWKTNTHQAGTPWMLSEIEAKLIFLPIFKITTSWFLMLMLIGFVVVATASVVYLISFGHYGFMGNFGFGSEHM